MEIKTNRLLFRTYEEKDAERLMAIADNKNIAWNMTDAFPYPCTLEKVRECIKDLSSLEKRDKNFVIIFEGEIVGCIGFRLKDGFREGSASGECWIGEDYWGKGIGTEGWDALVDYIFGDFDVRKISVGTFSWNIASIKILDKCGFTEEGCIESELVRFGKVCNECRYGLLKSEWEVLKNKI